jgi:hypothetical protein
LALAVPLRGSRFLVRRGSAFFVRRLMTILIPGKYYTVTSGRFKGITGIAVPAAGVGRAHALHSIDFPDDGVISFLGSSHLRAATAQEELEYRRRDDPGGS